tara:strand:- start:28 stop:405 length:378 start_codon:yes stop_codon:yes gene_type:complete
MEKSKFNQLSKFVLENVSSLEKEEGIEYGGNLYDAYYYGDDDEIIIVKYSEDGDVEEFLDTDSFDSFMDTRDLETFQDHWDYARETVYQTYSTMDWDDFLSEYGIDELVEFIYDELKNKEVKIIK